MDEETLIRILDKKLEPIKNMIKDLEIKNAGQYIEMSKEIKQMSAKLTELIGLKQVTKENYYDISNVKSYKISRPLKFEESFIYRIINLIIAVSLLHNHFLL